MWGRAQLPKTVKKSSLIHTYKLWNFQSTALLTGGSIIYPLSQMWQMQLILQQYTIHILDCAIRFDTYNTADEAFRHGVSPESIADCIKVSRAFTPYQILDGLYQFLEKGSPISDDLLVTECQKKLYFILAPTKQFFDGDVAFDEGLFLLEKLLSVIKKISDKKIPLMVVENQKYHHPVFASIFPKLQALAAPVFTLKQEHNEHKPTYSLHVAKFENNSEKKHIL